MKHVIIPIFIPHKGCPFDCIFCNQKSISGQIEDVTLDEVTRIVEEHLASITADAYVEISFYGGSFTGIERAQQIEYLKKANEYISSGKVSALRLSTRPDYISEEILEYLKLYNVKTIELGVQSLDQEVLDMTCRGHSCEEVYRAAALIKQYGIDLGIQTMIGLPGDSRQKDIYTASQVIKLAPDAVRIYPTLVIKGTYLEKMYLDGRYRPVSLDEAVDICTELLEMYRRNSIRVIRIGLQPTDSINEGAEVAAGPFHAAFRQLVESRLALHRIEQYIESSRLEKAKAIAIFTGSRNISNIVGQKRINIYHLKNKYKFEEVEVKIDPSMDDDFYIKAL